MKYAYLALVPLLLAPDGLIPNEFAAMAQQNRPGQSQNARPPAGGGGAAKPPSGGGNPAHPPSGGGNATRPPSGGGNATRPPSGGGNATRPPSGGGNATRPPSGGGNATRPPSGGNNQRPPSNTNRPPSNNGRPPVVTQPHRPGMGRPSTFRPMHAAPFRYPHGYSYRRWRTSMILPAIFLSSAYLFQDYAMIGVGPPPAGYYWVRYGPDLLLVNRYNRAVVDVIYGAFY